MPLKKIYGGNSEKVTLEYIDRVNRSGEAGAFYHEYYEGLRKHNIKPYQDFKTETIKKDFKAAIANKNYNIIQILEKIILEAYKYMIMQEELVEEYNNDSLGYFGRGGNSDGRY